MIRQLLERKNRFLILGQDYDHHALIRQIRVSGVTC